MGGHSGKSALIVCNGEAPSVEIVQHFWSKVDIKVGADGGANFLIQNGWNPDVIIGDLDSLHQDNRTKVQEIIHLEEQQTNDLDKAIRYCLQHQVEEIQVLGAAGGRCDHFLVNLQVLYKYSAQMKLVLWAGNEKIEFICKSWQESLPLQSTLSLVPLFGPVYGIQTQGLKYPLKGEDLEPLAGALGISNQVIADPVHITVHEGRVAVVTPYQLV